MREASHQAMDKAVEKVEGAGEQRGDEPLGRREEPPSTLRVPGTTAPGQDPLH
jgi:hypothetical protein